MDGANHRYDPAEQTGDPEDFDPVVHAARAGDLPALAAAAREGDVYRMSTLDLTAADVVRLRQLLDARGLAMDEAPPHWLFSRR